MHLEILAVIILILIYYYLMDCEKTCELPTHLAENMNTKNSLHELIKYSPLSDPIPEGNFTLTNKQQSKKLSTELHQIPTMSVVGNMQLSKAFTPVYERSKTDNLHLQLPIKTKKDYNFYPDNDLFNTRVRNMNVIIDRIDIDGYTTFFKPKFADDKNEIIDYVNVTSYEPIVILLYSKNNFVAGTFISNPNGAYKYTPNYNIYVGNYDKRNIRDVDFNNYNLKMIDNDIVSFINTNPSKLIYSRYLP